jgi:hypothetical protein
MSIMVPVAEARVTFLSDLAHGRRLLATGQYLPHIVLGPQSQRVAIRDGNRMTETYLGVMFVGGPDKMEPGDTAEVKLALMYFPEDVPRDCRNPSTEVAGLVLSWLLF